MPYPVNFTSNELNLIHELSKTYKNNLLDKKFTFFYNNTQDKHLENVVVRFRKRNFAHLVGLSKNPNGLNNAEKIFDAALNNSIKPNDCFTTHSKQTTLEKISNAQSIFDLVSTCNEISVLDSDVVNITSDSIVGGKPATTFSFVDVGEDTLVPNSLLNGNITINSGNNPINKILCTLVETPSMQDPVIDELSFGMISKNINAQQAQGVLMWLDNYKADEVAGFLVEDEKYQQLQKIANTNEITLGEVIGLSDEQIDEYRELSEIDIRFPNATTNITPNGNGGYQFDYEIDSPLPSESDMKYTEDAYADVYKEILTRKRDISAYDKADDKQLFLAHLLLEQKPLYLSSFSDNQSLLAIATSIVTSKGEDINTFTTRENETNAPVEEKDKTLSDVLGSKTQDYIDKLDNISEYDLNNPKQITNSVYQSIDIEDPIAGDVIDLQTWEKRKADYLTHQDIIKEYNELETRAGRQRFLEKVHNGEWTSTTTETSSINNKISDISNEDQLQINCEIGERSEGYLTPHLPKNLSFAMYNAVLGEIDNALLYRAGYDKTDFRLSIEWPDSPTGTYVYEGRYDLGDGHGSLINSIKNYRKHIIDIVSENPNNGVYDDSDAQRATYVLNKIIPVLNNQKELSNDEKLAFNKFRNTFSQVDDLNTNFISQHIKKQLTNNPLKITKPHFNEDEERQFNELFSRAENNALRILNEFATGVNLEIHQKDNDIEQNTGAPHLDYEFIDIYTRNPILNNLPSNLSFAFVNSLVKEIDQLSDSEETISYRLHLTSPSVDITHEDKQIMGHWDGSIIEHIKKNTSDGEIHRNFIPLIEENFTKLTEQEERALKIFYSVYKDIHFFNNPDSEDYDYYKERDTIEQAALKVIDDFSQGKLEKIDDTDLIDLYCQHNPLIKYVNEILETKHTASQHLPQNKNIDDKNFDASVSIKSSENVAIDSLPSNLSFGFYNKLLGIVDTINRKSQNHGYQKTQLTLNIKSSDIDNLKYSLRYDLGDGHGSLINRIETYQKNCISPQENLKTLVTPEMTKNAELFIETIIPQLRKIDTVTEKEQETLNKFQETYSKVLNIDPNKNKFKERANIEKQALEVIVEGCDIKNDKNNSLENASAPVMGDEDDSEELQVSAPQEFVQMDGTQAETVQQPQPKVQQRIMPDPRTHGSAASLARAVRARREQIKQKQSNNQEKSNNEQEQKQQKPRLSFS